MLPRSRRRIKAVHELEFRLCGGGRGKSLGVSKARQHGSVYADTSACWRLMNAVVLQDALEKLNVHTGHVSHEIPQLRNHSRRAVRYLKKNALSSRCRHCNPYFNRIRRRPAGPRIKADIILKATKVDGLFADPSSKPLHAFDCITYRSARAQ